MNSKEILYLRINSLFFLIFRCIKLQYDIFLQIVMAVQKSSEFICLCQKLSNELSTAFDRTVNFNPACQSIDSLTNSFLSEDSIANLIKHVISPFGSMSLNHGLPVLAIKMVKLIQCCIDANSRNPTSIKYLLKLVRERRIYKWIDGTNR
jgi:hypothetical protein